MFLKPLLYSLAIGLITGCGILEKCQVNRHSYYRLSSRFFYPNATPEHASTIEAIEKLQPGFIEWTYSDAPDVIESYKQKGVKYSIALNPQLPDSSGYTTKSFRIEDINGKMYVAPWMKNWEIKNPYWGCVNNPKFYTLFLNRARKLAGLGAYAVMVDDALFNARLYEDGKVGCFCPHCTELFLHKDGEKLKSGSVKSEMLAKLETKGRLKVEEDSLVKAYVTFQNNSVVKFHKKWMLELSRDYPDLLFYANNYGGLWNEIYQQFDGGIAEIGEAFMNEKKLDSLYLLAETLHKQQIFTLRSSNDSLQLALMDYNARHKQITLLPWDIYLGEKKNRYYMKLGKIQAFQNELKKRYNYY